MTDTLFDVQYVAGNIAGPFIITGPNLGRLQQLVNSQLTSEERFGQPYALDCLATNISGVNEDAACGRIPRPTTVEEYAAAILTEYRANLAVMPPEVGQRLFAYYSQN